MDDLGRRVAALRAERGWTQQQLADRLGMSRAAVSHLEAAMSVASERTVTVLAGLFKQEPHELVAGTTYPAAKAERLPVVACRYTEVELQLRLLGADLARLDVLPAPARARLLDEWDERLATLAKAGFDAEELRALAAARRAARALRRPAAGSGP